MPEAQNKSYSDTPATSQQAEASSSSARESKSSKPLQAQQEQGPLDEQGSARRDATFSSEGGQEAASATPQEQQQIKLKASRGDEKTFRSPQRAMQPENANKEKICIFEDDYLQAQLGMAECMLSYKRSKAVKPLMDILKKSIPRNSPLAFALDFGDRASDVKLKSGSDRDFTSIFKPDDLWAKVERSSVPEPRILVLYDINSEWCEAICTRFPHSIHRKFILEHVLGLLSPTSEHDFSTFRSPSYPEEGDATYSLTGRKLSGIYRPRVPIFDKPKNFPCERVSVDGFHVNYWRQYESKSSRIRPSAFSACDLQRFGDSWIKLNAFVSCCRLEKNLHLVLTSKSSPLWKKRIDQLAMGSERMICIGLNAMAGMMTRLPDHGRRTPGRLLEDTAIDMMQRNQPIFGWYFAPKGAPLWSAVVVDDLVFTSQLTAKILRFGVEELEGRLRDIAYSMNVQGDADRFRRLTDFRRSLGRHYLALNESRYAFKTCVKDDLAASGIISGPGMPGSKDTDENAPSVTRDASAANSSKPSPRVDFSKFYLDTLEKLQERLDTIKEDLNEEIQVAIGAVQVQDAQIMKEQTRITVRQTNMTVVLAVLAAVYLPMTLVTGIFGMNITEISSESTAPSAWWVVVVWLATVVLTAGGISIYLVVRRLKAKEKKKKPCEADTEEGLLSSDEDDSESSNSGPRVTGWKGIKIGKWRKKTKKH